ncbi:thioredoxin-like protein, partial [Nadsonia fulvescens var. elongata DSM 6958]
MLLKYIVAFIGLSQSAQAGLYSSSSPVLQVNTPADFDTMVLDTNHTSVVEFYAPWCGHCKTLAPQFDKSARKMEGIVNFVAVDCDRGKLKPLCAKYGIRGFPTVKSFRRGKTPAKGSKTTAPTIEDYEGARNVKSLVRYAETKIRNHVTLINKAPAFESFLSTAATPRVVLVSQKATTTPDLLKALAIDFIDTVAVAYVPGKSASG